MSETYRITSNLSEMDLDAIYAYLSKSYWAEGIPFETMKRSFENSICSGILTEEDIQVGFARVITDSATFAYLADVFINEEHRGKGLSKRLIKHIVASPNLQGLRRIVLATRDAHGLYEQFGFKALANPQIFMELWDPHVYKKT